MRFVILTQHFWPEIGAAQVRLAALALELSRQGHHVEIVTAMPNYPTGSIFDGYRNRLYMCEEWNGVTIHRSWVYASMGAGIGRILNYLSFPVTSLNGLLRVRPADVIFVETPPPFLGIPAYLAALIHRAQLVYNVADLWTDALEEMGFLRPGLILNAVKSVERWALRRSSLVTVVTEGLKATVITQKGVAPNRVLFLPNGVDLDIFAPSLPDERVRSNLGLDGHAVILYAGTHGFCHGVDVALHAARILKSERIKFVFVGDGSEKTRLLSLAAELQLSNVVFLDPVPVDQVNRLYSVACAGLSTLRDIPMFEATRPAKVLATMAAGKPVLYSGRGEGASLVTEANAGVVIEPENPGALADAISSIVRSPEFAAELGMNGRRYVEENYSWPVIVKRWVGELKEARELR